MPTTRGHSVEWEGEHDVQLAVSAPDEGPGPHQGVRRAASKDQGRAGVCAAVHEGQRRAADGAPFIEHPTEVGELLYEAGATDEVIAAGLLHDALEKTDATVYELSARFGRRVSEIVGAVTDDNRIVEYSRRKAALRDQVAEAGDDALEVFAADKLSKVRELRLGDGSSVKTRARRLENYRLSLAMLEQRLPDSPLVAALAVELDALQGTPNALDHAH
ncbi:MAG: HD domain-containing protein [Solirubrobacteraceae bacterium]